MKSVIITIAALYSAVTAVGQNPSPAKDDMPDPLLDCYVVDQPNETAISDIGAQTDNAELRGFCCICRPRVES